MIISHKYKYVFIELPMTGSTAIARELIENYDGQKMLAKHSSPKDFHKVCSPEEREYFMFSGIRNPLDEAVSRYHKYKSDHNQKFSKPFKPMPYGKFRRRLNRVRDKIRYNFIMKGAGFGDYFKRYYLFPYSNWSLVWHNKMDFIIRFENLNEDFMQALKKMNIEPVRELPKKNKTSGKKGVFWDYYDSTELRQRAVNVFGTFLKKWNYDFPETWETKEPNGLARMAFNFANGIRMFYWKNLR